MYEQHQECVSQPIQVLVSGPFKEGEEWLIEHLLVATLDGSALGAPLTFIKVGFDGTVMVPVANFTPYPRVISIGKPLGIARDPHAWLDKLEPDMEKGEEAWEKLGALIHKITEQSFIPETGPAGESETDLVGPKTATVSELETYLLSHL